MILDVTVRLKITGLRGAVLRLLWRTERLYRVTTHKDLHRGKSWNPLSSYNFSMEIKVAELTSLKSRL